MVRSELEVKIDVIADGLQERLADLRKALEKLEPNTAMEAMGVLYQLNGLLQYVQEPIK